MTDIRQAIRAQLRQRREQLTTAECAHLSGRICEHLVRSRLFRTSHRIACYFPHGKEVDLTDLMLQAWAQGKTTFLPVLARFPKGHLWWLPYYIDTPLYRNRFGIPEPAHARRLRSTKLRSLDLILVPLVAFDSSGQRIGMGGGFYDRSLARIRHTHSWHRPRRIGVAFSWQEVEHIPAQPWDVPLDGIVTDQGITTFRST